MVSLPPLPDRERLKELCREVSTAANVQPFAVEKDFYLTRLIWALAQQLQAGLLLKGGTLLSKVDLGYRRMSEDVDLVIPWAGSRTYRAINVGEMRPVREALKSLAPMVGLRFERYDGYPSEKQAHVIWELPYESTFGPQTIDVEVALRPVLRPPRRVPLAQLLRDPIVGDYSSAYCWALDADEARAEKVRAAFTRAALRDFYDLDQLDDLLHLGGRQLALRSATSTISINCSWQATTSSPRHSGTWSIRNSPKFTLSLWPTSPPHSG